MMISARFVCLICLSWLGMVKCGVGRSKWTVTAGGDNHQVKRHNVEKPVVRKIRRSAIKETKDPTKPVVRKKTALKVEATPISFAEGESIAKITAELDSLEHRVDNLEHETQALQVCAVGDDVSAIWATSGQYYDAVIASINSDGTITVNWNDGDTTARTMNTANVKKNGVACSDPAYTDLGRGKCLWNGQDPPHKYEHGTDSDGLKCRQLCNQNPECSGYSASNVNLITGDWNNCLLWLQKPLSGGGDPNWGEAHCHVKNEATPATPAPTQAVCEVDVNLDRGFKMTSYRINNLCTKTVTVAPGANVSMHLEYSNSETACPGCIEQLYVGVRGQTLDCIFNGNPSGHTSDDHVLHLSALPVGTYEIVGRSSWQYSCQQYTDGTLLATVIVQTTTPVSSPCKVTVYEHWPEGSFAGISGLQAAEQAWGGKFPTGQIKVLDGVGNHPLNAFSNLTSSVKVEGFCCKAFGYTSADCSGTEGTPIESTTQLLSGLPAGVVTPATGIASVWGCNDCAQCVKVTQQCTPGTGSHRYNGQFSKLSSFTSTEYDGVTGSASLVTTGTSIRTEVRLEGSAAFASKTFHAHLHALPCASDGGGHYQNPSGNGAVDNVNENWPWLTCDPSSICTGSATNSWTPSLAELAAGMSIVVHDTPNGGAKAFCADLATTTTYVGQFSKLSSFTSTEYDGFTGSVSLVTTGISIHTEARMSGSAAFASKTFHAHLHALPCASGGGGHYQNPKGDGSVNNVNENWPWLTCDTHGVCTASALNAWTPSQTELAVGMSIVVHDTPNGGAKAFCADLAQAR